MKQIHKNLHVRHILFTFLPALPNQWRAKSKQRFELMFHQWLKIHTHGHVQDVESKLREKFITNVHKLLQKSVSSVERHSVVQRFSTQKETDRQPHLHNKFIYLA